MIRLTSSLAIAGIALAFVNPLSAEELGGVKSTPLEEVVQVEAFVTRDLRTDSDVSIIWNSLSKGRTCTEQGNETTCRTAESLTDSTAVHEVVLRRRNISLNRSRQRVAWDVILRIAPDRSLPAEAFASTYFPNWRRHVPDAGPGHTPHRCIFAYVPRQCRMVRLR